MENESDLAKIYNFAEEKKKRGSIARGKTELRKGGTPSQIVNLAVKKTEWEIFDDDEVLRNYWEKRRIDNLILEGSMLPSYDQLVELMENESYGIADVNPLNRELAGERFGLH